MPKIYAEFRPEIVREKDGVTPRTSFAAHTYNDAYARLARHPRLIEPAKQILGDDVYIHQFKINGKQAFDGDVWQWHQDYGTWRNDDQMPEARAMNVAIFLDEVPTFRYLATLPYWLARGQEGVGQAQAATAVARG